MVYECGLRLAARLSLVVQVSGGALARTSSVAPSIKIKSKFRGNKGRHNFWSRAFSPALFSSAGLLLLQEDLRVAPIFRDGSKEISHVIASQRVALARAR